MNPWDILTWIAVLCLAVVIVVLTYAFARGVLRGARRARERTTVIQKQDRTR